MKYVFDVNEYEVCVNKGEPSSFDEGSWEEPYMLEESYGDSCEEPYFKYPYEGLFEDMTYE